jgi:hypothetical protein
MPNPQLQRDAPPASWLRAIELARWAEGGDMCATLMRFGIVLMVVPLLANANPGSKYAKGDCITPVDNDYSWYGKYARVEAFSRIDGVSEKPVYVLAFPKSASNSVIFEQSIETHTHKVEKGLCVPN